MDAHKSAMEYGIAHGWWPEFNDKGPLDWPRKVSLTDLPPNAKMAHAMAAAGFCKSVGDGRRNGWNRQVAIGVFIVDKMQHRLEIIP